MESDGGESLICAAQDITDKLTDPSFRAAVSGTWDGDPIGFKFDPQNGAFFKLWGNITGWEKTPLHWFLCIACFGWIWMAL